MPQKLGFIVYKVGKKTKQNVGGKLEYTLGQVNLFYK